MTDDLDPALMRAYAKEDRAYFGSWNAATEMKEARTHLCGIVLHMDDKIFETWIRAQYILTAEQVMELQKERHQLAGSKS
jgi:hypothetical protein